MKKVTDLLFKTISKKPIVYILAAYWVLANSLAFPLVFKIKALSGFGVPDMMPAHGAKELHEAFTAYGVEGMKIYEQLGFYDLFLPSSYALFFGSIIFLLYSNSRLRHLAWLPVITAVLDYTENYFFHMYTNDILNISSDTASLTGIIVAMKMTFFALTLITTLSGLVKKFVLKKP